MDKKRFRYIIIPTILWYITGRFLLEIAYNFYWVKIVKKEPLWSDAKPCDKKWCRFCGNGLKNKNKQE